MWMIGRAQNLINSSSYFIAASLFSISCYAGTVGPGTVAPFTVTDGSTTTILGDTTVTATSSHGISVTRGTVELGGPNITVIANQGTGYGFNIDSTANASFLRSVSGASVTIETAGTSHSYGIWAHDATKVAGELVAMADNVTIRTTSNGAGGIILANEANGLFNYAEITTSGGRDPNNNNAGAYGINTQYSGKGEFNHIKIKTTGESGTGVLNTNKSSFIGNDLHLDVTGYGLNSQTGATMTANNATIITRATTGIGIRASNADFATTGLHTTFTGEHLSVETYGDSGYGVNMRSQSHGTISNINVKTQGTNAHGLLAVDEGARLQVNHATVHTNGTTSAGVYAYDDAYLHLTNGSVRTDGANSIGALVEASSSAVEFSKVELNNSVFHTYGQEAHALQLNNGGTITARNTIFHTHGVGATGLTMVISPDFDNNQVTLNSSQLISDRDAGISISGGDPKIHLNNSVVTGHTNWLVVNAITVTPIKNPYPHP